MTAIAVMDCINSVYESILLPGGQHNLMRDTARLVGANSGEVHIAFRSKRRMAEQLPYYGEYSIRDWEAISNAYNNQYFPDDIRWRRMSEKPSGNVVRDSELLSPPELHRSSLYNELLIPWGRNNQALHYGEYESFNILTNLCRDTRAGPFDNEEMSLLKAVFPHVHRAALIHIKLGDLDSRMFAAAEMVDSLRFGVVLLSSTGRIVFANSFAERMINARDGISVDRDVIQLGSTSRNSELQKALQNIRSPRIGCDGSELDSTIVVPRSSGARPYFVHVLPMSQRVKVFSCFYALAMLCIFDSDRNSGAELSRVCRSLSLSTAETRLVRQLVDGSSLAEAAAQFGVSQHTVRDQLKAVFAKTETNRQGELISFLMRAL